MLDSRAGLDGKISRHVRDLRGRGATWTEIGDAVGTTQQAAQIRWEKKNREAANAERNQRGPLALQGVARWL